MSNLRPILPKVDEISTTSEREPPQSNTLRKHVILACTACKKRKTKCDGADPPCQMCVRKGTECYYVDPQAKLEDLKSRNEELTREVSQYSALVRYLRSGTPDESNEVLSRLRTGPSVDSVLRQIEHGQLLLTPSSNSGSTQSSPTSSSTSDCKLSKRKFGESVTESETVVARFEADGGWGASTHRRNLDSLSVSFLTGAAGSLWRAHGSDWTAITNDNRLVAELISSFFDCYQSSNFQLIDKDLFLEALAQGPGANFCSPLLVNSICAAGCHVVTGSPNSQFQQGRTTPWDNWIGRQFLDESLRLWRDLEDGRESLVNLQSAVILCDIFSHNGEDKKGTSFLLIACQIARGLGILRDPMLWHGEPQDGRVALKWRRARTTAAWGLFCYQGRYCYALQRFPLLRRPPIADMPSDADRDIVRLLFRAECKLAMITVMDISTLKFSDDDGYSGYAAPSDKTDDMYQKLIAFQSQLRPEITFEPDGDPSRMLLQIYIQFIIVSLFSPGSLQTTESKIALATLRNMLNLFSVCWGFGKVCPYWVSHVLLSNGLLALEDKKSAEAYAALMVSIVGLGEMAQKFVVCEATLKALKVKAEKAGVHLSLRASQALVVVNQPDWLSKAQTHFRSGIPMSLASASVDSPDNERLDNMLKAWSINDD